MNITFQNSVTPFHPSYNTYIDYQKNHIKFPEIFEAFSATEIASLILYSQMLFLTRVYKHKNNKLNTSEFSGANFSALRSFLCASWKSETSTSQREYDNNPSM